MFFYDIILCYYIQPLWLTNSIHLSYNNETRTQKCISLRNNGRKRKRRVKKGIPVDSDDRSRDLIVVIKTKNLRIFEAKLNDFMSLSVRLSVHGRFVKTLKLITELHMWKNFIKSEVLLVTFTWLLFSYMSWFESKSGFVCLIISCSVLCFEKSFSSFSLCPALCLDLIYRIKHRARLIIQVKHPETNDWNWKAKRDVKRLRNCC